MYRICMQMTAETIATVIKADQKPAEEAIIETPPMDRNDTRLRVLRLYQFLLTQTDKEHPLTANSVNSYA